MTIELHLEKKLVNLKTNKKVLNLRILRKTLYVAQDNLTDQGTCIIKRSRRL